LCPMLTFSVAGASACRSCGAGSVSLAGSSSCTSCANGACNGMMHVCCLIVDPCWLHNIEL
jgi:hypothetical protein